MITIHTHYSDAISVSHIINYHIRQKCKIRLKCTQHEAILVAGYDVILWILPITKVQGTYQGYHNCTYIYGLLHIPQNVIRNQ